MSNGCGRGARGDDDDSPDDYRVLVGSRSHFELLSPPEEDCGGCDGVLHEVLDALHLGGGGHEQRTERIVTFPHGSDGAISAIEVITLCGKT